MPTQTPPTEPRRIDRFELLSELGRGGMGVVYAAVDRATEQRVAIKVLLAGQHKDDDARERFLREARLAAGIRHPNLVSVLEQGWNGDLPYLVQELVEGPALDELLQVEEALEPQRAAAIAEQLARALHHAHTCGLVHRDVKPGNVLLTGDDTPRLTDFGLALDATSARLTATGQVLGTPTYMAPEQAVGERDVPGELSDQYSLGAVLYEMLAGRPPFVGDTAAQVLMSLVAERPPPLPSLRDVPGPLAVITHRAMARRPHRRYASCAALADDLLRFQQGRPIVARPPSLVERVVDHLGPRRLRMMAALLSFGLVFGSITGYLVVRQVQAQRAYLAREAAAHGALEHLGRKLHTLEGDERQRAVARFLDEPAHEGTAAAADLLLAEGARAARSGDVEHATVRYAEAYARSPDPEHHQQALLGLAHAFVASWRFDDLAMLAHTLGQAHPGTEALPTLRARARLARGDLHGASVQLSTTHPEVASLLSTLATAQTTPMLDIGGRALHRRDGEVIGVRTDGDEVLPVRLTREGPVPGTALPTRSPTWPLDTTPPTFLSREAARLGEPARIVLVDDDGRTLASFADATVLDAVAADLDRDGLDEVYVGIGPYARHLAVLLEQPDGSWRLGPSVPELDAAASDITALLVPSDRSELWVAAGAWSAYDVRRYQRRGGQLERVDRARIGYVPRMMELSDGRIALLDSDEYPSREGFSAGRRYGAPRGIYFGDPTGPLLPDGHLPVPGPDGLQLKSLHAGDLDGDGDEDLVVWARHASSDRSATLLWAGTDHGFDGPWVLDGFAPSLIANLDGDDADELVVGRDGQGWILGAGSESLPTAPPRTNEARLVPPHVGEPLSSAWRRAEALVGMGLGGKAAAALVELHDPSSPSAATLLGRAAQLYAASGQGTRAADLFAEAAQSDPSLTDEAVSALLRDHRPHEATALGSPEPAWLDEERRIDLLDQPGFLADPQRRDRRHLPLQAVASGPPLAAARLDWEGPHLRLDLDLTLERIEWGAGIDVRIHPEGDPERAIGVGARGWGGGGLLEHEVGCLHDGLARHRGEVSGPSDAGRWRLRVDLLDGELLCALTGPDGHEQTDRVPFQLPTGPLRIEVVPSPHAGFRTHQLAEVTLHELAVRGTGIRLAEVIAVPPSRLAGVADGTLAEEALLQAVESHPEALPRWLRLDTATLAPRLARSLGTEAIPPFLEAFQATVHHHPHDALTQRALTVSAAPLLALDRSDASTEVHLAAATLRARRGMAWSGLGEVDAARLDLEGAVDEIEQLAARGAVPRRELASLAFLVHRELASMEARRGAEEAAMVHVRRAVDWHASPIVARDLLRARPELQGLDL
jgi:hypothetical protein